MKFWGRYIMLAGCCLFAYRRGGGAGLSLFGALYSYADGVIEAAQKQIAARAQIPQSVPTEDEANDPIDRTMDNAN